MCPYIADQRINTGSFFSTTDVFDPGLFKDISVNSEEFKELLVRLAQSVNNSRIYTNQKVSGFNLTEEFVSGKIVFNPATNDPNLQRAGFLKVINVGALGGGVTNTAHGLAITSDWKFLSCIGMASNTATFNYYPLPFASAGGANNIEVRVDATNIVITNNSGSVFTDCYVTLEYVKN